MISIRGQDWLAGIISSFSKELGLTDLSLILMQVQRIVLERGIPAEKETDTAGKVRSAFVLGISYGLGGA